MSDKKRLMIRFALSAAFGLCVMMVPLWLIEGSSGSTYIAYRQTWTRKMIKMMDQEIHSFHASHGKYPAPSEDIAGWSRDAWSRPLRYSIQGGKPLIESLGRDGVRGGIGLDADLSNRNPKPPGSEIPFSQIITDPTATGMNIASVVCGVLGGLMFCRGLANQSFERRTWPALGAAFLLALCVAGYGAMVITMFHIPSGH